MSSTVKSFSFPKGETRGDTFYIKHGVDSFTVIDCYLLTGSQYAENNRQEEIIDEIIAESAGRIRRFISTHPDNDHIAGIDALFRRWPTKNFYAVANDIPSDEDDLNLKKYIELKDNDNFAITRGITRCWLNDSNIEHNGSGIFFQWPILTDSHFQAALKKVADGNEVNNICPIFTYSVNGGAKYMWMGDLETSMQQHYYDACKDSVSHVNILFQPHHGRKSGAVPNDLLETLNPQLIIIGNAPSDHIDYGDSQMTITQNTSGDLTFINEGGSVHIYSQNEVTNPPSCLVKLHDRVIKNAFETEYYCGTLTVR